MNISCFRTYRRVGDRLIDPVHQHFTVFLERPSDGDEVPFVSTTVLLGVNVNVLPTDRSTILAASQY